MELPDKYLLVHRNILMMSFMTRITNDLILRSGIGLTVKRLVNLEKPVEIVRRRLESRDSL